MTTLDSMTARHAAGQPLTAEEVGLLLDCAFTLLVLTGSKKPRDNRPLWEFTEPLNAPAPAPQPEQKVCEWRFDEPDWMFKTACKESHTFEILGPVENKHRFCPYCGKPIREVGGDQSRPPSGAS